jgi:poly(3-hydroxybutyrate) depolymerase
MSKWADAQDCEGTVTPYPTSQDGVLGIACVQHANCGSGAEVVHCTWDGAHDWPQADEARPGNEIIWDFFEKHSRGGAVAGGEPGS